MAESTVVGTRPLKLEEQEQGETGCLQQNSSVQIHCFISR